MKIEQQVCSLEWAKKLKELGVKQNSLFYYVGQKLYFKTELGLFNSLGRCMTNTMFEQLTDLLKNSAFTSAELGEMLPPSIVGNNFAVYQIDGHWHITYSTSTSWWIRQIADTEADARAKMLVYLLENKLITL